MSDVLLAASAVTRRFGGLTAVNGVSLQLQRGQVHAVIGTNGAGKSTLINILSGELAPSSGQVMLGNRDITAWRQPDRARAGLGRSYQRSTIFPELSVFENCRLAAQARRQRFWHWWRSASECRHSAELARHALERTGLADDAAREAGLLPHGRKRQLEIAMCLAGEPQVLLLDEPLAGMGPEETDRILDLLETLKPGHAILLVEHDMDAVFRVAETITVMVNGAAIASGTPDEIRANPDVRTAYLGEDSHGASV
ncbi:ABC transporter ATP-binding protein [Achromobacter pestifer]|uniref:ABC transporter ATP-binding protein n=1 Tax=Achromobacter pestifer TaxID=1353889 RepID=A0A7D4HT47_9BURK|nr:ABC transporter ATP-binding protein [Achromobacter pestifer]QKH37239.1 ABC transporter ATP-binding protein [Achromobacter pestifer]